MGIEVPTPIQRLAIQPVLDGRDVIAKAETGTGKTMAFGAPMMSKIDPSRSTILGLVLCPTRELAQQVATVLMSLGEPRGQRVALLVGGDPIHPQISDIKRGAQVVVGTPGRILDLHQQRFLTFPWTQFAVLDEADRMFEIGFLDDVRRILDLLPSERQTLLFSATYPDEILQLARDTTRDPIEVATARGAATTETIKQKVLQTTETQRHQVLERILRNSDEGDIFLVFCERRTDVDRLLRRLERSRLAIAALHGGYDQAARTLVMSSFRKGEYKALLATDVASRGLDVERVSHVVNYSVPRELKDYTHRIGRTGRAGRSGTAITFLVPEDFRRWDRIRRESGWEIERYEFPQDRSSDSRGASRSQNRDRSRSRDRADSQDRPRSRDRADSQDRPRSRDRADSQDRPRSRDRADSQDRSRSRDRADGQDRPRSRDRADSQDRPRSRDRADGQDRSRSRDRADSQDRSRSNRSTRGASSRSTSDDSQRPSESSSAPRDSSREKVRSCPVTEEGTWPTEAFRKKREPETERGESSGSSSRSTSSKKTSSRNRNRKRPPHRGREKSD